MSKNRDIVHEHEKLVAAQTSPEAFERIFQKYHDAIFSYSLHRTCDAILAQDITANTFLKAFEHIKDFKWRGISLSSWLYRIATNEINLHYRKTKRLVAMTPELAETLRDDETTDKAVLEIEEMISKNKKFKRACLALFKLRLKYQTVLTLRYFEEKPIKEVAEILSLSENTVKTQIRRGLIQLRKQYEKTSA